MIGKLIWLLFKRIFRTPVLLLPLLAYILYLLPVTAYLRTSYVAHPYGNNYINCTYMSIHGTKIKYWDYCPFIVVLKKEDYL